MNKTTAKLTIIAAALLLSTTAHSAGVAVNETGNQPDASAMLDMQNSTKGFLPPRMTAAQKGAIAAPATGLMIYQTDAPTGLYVYDGTVWKQVDAGTVTVANGGTGTSTGSITGSGALTFAAGGSDQNVTLTPSGTGYTLLGGKVGIGTATLNSDLNVNGATNSHIELQSAGTPKGYLWWDNTTNGGILGVGPGTTNASIIFKNNNVGIGTTAPEVKLDVNEGTLRSFVGNNGGISFIAQGGGSNFQIRHDSSTDVFFVNSGGGAYVFRNIDGSAYGTVYGDSFSKPSDYRLKSNIVNTHFGIADVMKIAVRDYTYKADAANTPTTGFIAQELYEIFPNADTKPANAEDMWGVDYGKVTPLLVKGMQDLKAENEGLKSENEALKARLLKIEKALGL
jgi:hypothetical protein